VKIVTFPVGPLACNCSLLIDDVSRQAIIVDPGDEADGICRLLEENEARPVLMLHTHAHFDHIGASRLVKERTGASIALHPADRFLYDSLPQQGRMFGFEFSPPLAIDLEISDGQEFSLGEERIRAIHTPGHSPGSVCFLAGNGEDVLFSGDTLFRDSIGRTDLWGGSFETIDESIRQKLYSLPDSLRVIPGHGEETSIGREKRSNPFVRLC
jgi:glyoxylase-like metal-dependent hydrolase (beta-lactamase superfamily II)